jgi:hypothetical protein
LRPSREEEISVTVCPVCLSQNQTIVVGYRVRGTCNDCGARWDRERDRVRILAPALTLEKPVQPVSQQG